MALQLQELSTQLPLVSRDHFDHGNDRVVVADLVFGRVRRVGSVGAGPGEYRQAGRLFALPGDSTLLIDSPERGRWWLLLHRDSIVSD